MVVDASLTRQFIESDWTSDGIRRFAFSWEAFNFNQTGLFGYYPQSLLDASFDCAVSITGLSIGYSGQVGAVCHPYICLMSVHYFPLNTFKTVLAEEYKHYPGLDLPVKRDAATSATQALWWGNMSGYLASDDFMLTLVGFIEPVARKPQEKPELQPVSLEGVRWPLTRRY